MSTLAALNANPAVKVLGLEHENKHVHEFFLFFFVLTIVGNLKRFSRPDNLVQEIAICLIRCFGSYGFVLPLVLGGLPSKTYVHFDSYLVTLIAAMFFVHVIAERFIPAEYMDVLIVPMQVGYSVIKGNACGHGFLMTAAVLPDSRVAPFVGAFLAVNGHRLLENGVSSLAAPMGFDGDYLLGIVGGPLYYVLIEYVRVSPLLARIVLVLFRMSAWYIDYNDVLNSVTALFGGEGKSSKKASPAKAGGRGRSRTPKKNK